MYVCIHIYIYVDIDIDICGLLASTAKIYTYTPIMYDTVYIISIRRCNHFLVVVYEFLSRSRRIIIATTIANVMMIVPIIVIVMLMIIAVTISININIHNSNLNEDNNQE